MSVSSIGASGTTMKATRQSDAAYSDAKVIKYSLAAADVYEMG